jgi:hypothetical protein
VGGGGQQNDNPRVIGRQYHTGHLCLGGRGEGNENLLWYVPLRLTGSQCSFHPAMTSFKT